MIRYSRKVREEAALICAIAASTPSLQGMYAEICASLGWKHTYGKQQFDLAVLAWCETFNVSCCDAEAEALIRTGWAP